MALTGDSKLWRGIIYTLAGGIGWGFSGACGQYLFSYQDVRPNWLTVIRMLIAGFLLCLFFFPAHKQAMTPIFKPGMHWLWILVYALGGLMISQFGYLTAVNYTNSGTATMLVYFNPVFILAAVCLIQKRLPTARELLAIGCAFAGTFFLATHGDISHLAISAQGLFWGLASALGIAVYTILPARFLSKYPTQPLMGVGMLVGGLITGLAINFPSIEYHLDTYGVLALILIILLGTIAAFMLYMQGVADLGSVKASMIACVEPISAAIFSVVFFGTHFVVMDYLGFAFIIATIFVLGRR